MLLGNLGELLDVDELEDGVGEALDDDALGCSERREGQ